MSEACVRFFMKCFITLQIMLSGIQMPGEKSAFLQDRRKCIHVILWRIMESAYQRMNRKEFLNGFTVWTKVIPVRQGEPAWDFLL